MNSTTAISADVFLLFQNLANAVPAWKAQLGQLVEASAPSSEMVYYDSRIHSKLGDFIHNSDLPGFNLQKARQACNLARSKLVPDTICIPWDSYFVRPLPGQSAHLSDKRIFTAYLSLEDTIGAAVRDTSKYLESTLR